jgi:hypothetical protein
MVHPITIGLARISPFLHRDIVFDFVREYSKALFINITESPDNNLRNFSYKKN